eukprot:g1665.t1
MSQLPYHSKFPRTQEMKVESEKLEDEFWHDLEKFEASLDRVKGQALSKVAAVADVAKGAMKENPNDNVFATVLCCFGLPSLLKLFCKFRRVW